jgi:hypothetical protein
MIVRVLQKNNQVLVCSGVADPVDEAAFLNVLTGEGFQVDRAAVLYVDSFGMSDHDQGKKDEEGVSQHVEPLIQQAEIQVDENIFRWNVGFSTECENPQPFVR